jgi:very-short-patch-repair endonuclease
MLDPADRRLAEFASARDGVFTTADAREAGLSNAQIHRRSMTLWPAIHEGVFRMPGAVPTWNSELRAACLAATQPGAVSHRSAAALYGVPGGRADLIEITCRRWNRTQRPGLVVHESTRFAEEDITEVDGIRVVTAERLILELAGLKPFPNYVESVIQAARRKRLITYDSTLATFNRLARRGVRGVKPMRIALERWDPRSRATHSEMETLLIQVLRAHGLPEPVPQFQVLDEFGNFVAQTDAGLPQWKITIEYQSKQEHSDEFQVARDDRRRNQIIAAGYEPLAARYDDLRNGGHVLVDEILRTARRRTAS